VQNAITKLQKYIYCKKTCKNYKILDSKEFVYICKSISYWKISDNRFI